MAVGRDVRFALRALRGTFVHPAVTGRLRGSRGAGLPEERLAAKAHKAGVAQG